MLSFKNTYYILFIICFYKDELFFSYSIWLFNKIYKCSLFSGIFKILGRNDILPCAVCETVGAVTHFAWMATFAWIGNDSNSLNLFNQKL